MNMEPLKVVVVDDERGAHAVLSAFLEASGSLARSVGQAYTALEGVAMIQRTHPDVVLLDIEMPNGTGFQLLEAMPERRFSVIFTTAHAAHAIKAIKTHPADYLLKPIDPEELRNALQRIHDERQGRDRLHIEVASLQGKEFVRIADLVRVVADGNYSHLHLLNGERITASRPIGHFEALLSATDFFRCHHSHVVNMAQVKAYQNRDGGVLLLRNGEEVPLASRKHAEFEGRMK